MRCLFCRMCKIGGGLVNERPLSNLALTRQASSTIVGSKPWSTHVCCGWSLLELLFPTPELTSCMQPASQLTERQKFNSLCLPYLLLHSVTSLVILESLVTLSTSCYEQYITFDLLEFFSKSLTPCSCRTMYWGITQFLECNSPTYCEHKANMVS